MPRWRRPLLTVLLVATAFAGFALSRTHTDGVTVERVTLESAAGDAVPALWLTPDRPRGTALLAHGRSASKETMFALAESLAAAGFECCVIDLPGHGDSRIGLTQRAPRDAFVAGARALSARRGGAPDGRIDLLVGHSFGASTGARAASAGDVMPTLLIAIGALPRPGATDTLLISGRFDELISREELRQHAATIGAGTVVVPWSDHVLEPFDPQVADAVVAAARSTISPALDPVVHSAAPARMAGCGLLLASALALIFLLLPRDIAGWRAGVVGASAGTFVVVALVAGFHGTWLYLAPTPFGAALAVTCAATWLAAAVGFERLTEQVTWLRGRGWATYALAMLAVCVQIVASALTDQRFIALISALLLILLVLGRALGLAVARRARSELAGHAAFAVAVGYMLGVWGGGFV